MEKQSKQTLIGLVVTILAIMFFLFLLFPALGHLREISYTVVCGTNLKCLSTAFTVYSNDYEDEYPKQGAGPWAKELGFDYDHVYNPDLPINEAAYTITSSLYLLVREADVSPKYFICPTPKQYRDKYKPTNYTPFNGHNSNKLDMVELWDFGKTPHDHVSYAYHNPYGKYPSGGWQSSSFAISADMSPWFQNGNIVSAKNNNNVPQIIQYSEKSTWIFGNSRNHELKERNYSEEQNVLYADGHITNEKVSNVGVKNDNIYTFWSTDQKPSEQDIQGGKAPTSRSADNDAKSKTDSFLAI